MNPKSGVMAFGAARTVLGLPRPLVFAVLAVCIAVWSAAADWMGALDARFDDPDSLMRLVEVRDWLAGQGWYDLLQPRLMPPDGVFMHWSRLVDAPIAGLILLARPIVGAEAAELWAVNLWPPLLALPLFAGLASIAYRFGGWTGAIWVLPLYILSPSVPAIFQPGRIDHHNLLAVLLAWMIAALVRASDGWRPAAFAGVLAALILAIGMEVVHAVALAAIGLSVAWVLDGTRYRAAAIGFGLAFAGATVAAFFATVAPDRWSVMACDALSPVYAISAAIGGLGLAAAARIVPSDAGDGVAGALMRGGALAGVSGLGLWVAALLFPLCLGGPYAGVDPALQPIWLDLTTEAKNVFLVWADEPTAVPIFFGPPIFTCITAVVIARKLPRDDRIGFHALIGLIAVCMAVGSFQIRGIIPAQILAIALAAAAVGIVWVRHAGETGLVAGLKRAVWIPLAPMVWFMVFLPLMDRGKVAAETVEGDRFALCRTELAAGLVDRPPARVAATISLGSFLLSATPHAVFAAPYHRGGDGILAMDALFTARMSDARLGLLRHRAEYVALCRADPAVDHLVRRAPDGFLAHLLDGDRPDWLQPVLATADSLLFRVEASATDVTGSTAPIDLRPTL